MKPGDTVTLIAIPANIQRKMKNFKRENSFKTVWGGYS
jgi:hypothetical protein